MMSATGSPLACKIMKVTRETPTHTTSRRTTRRMIRAGTRSVLDAGVEEPEPFVAPGLIGDLLGDAEHVVLGPQEDARRVLLDEPLDLGVGPLPPGLVDRRAALVDQLVEAFDPRVPLADPAARLRVVERVKDGVGVEDRVVAPAPVLAVGGLALALEELVPGRTGVPHLGGRTDTHLGQHLADRLEDRPERHERAVQRDVDAVGIAGLRE